MIIRKTPEQVDQMAAAGEILVRCLKMLASKTRAGITTEELDAWRKYISGLAAAAEPEPAHLVGEAKQAQPSADVMAEVVDFTPVPDQPARLGDKADRVPRAKPLA